MQPRGIALQASLCLLVSCCAACTQRHSEAQPQAVPAGNQAAEVKTDLNRSRTLEFGGQLNDPEGKQLPAVVGVLFAIYEQQEGGAPLWQEVQNVEVNKRGRFKAIVGSTKGEGIPPELFAPEKAVWMGTQMLLPGQVEQPRIRLVGSDGILTAEQIITPVAPEESHAQPPAAEVQEASSSPTVSQQSGSHNVDSGPTNGGLRARRGFRRQRP
jgi:hypothetical protein